jgi:hypothetical protein
MIKIPVCFFYKLKKTLYSFYKRVVNRISKYVSIAFYNL